MTNLRISIFGFGRVGMALHQTIIAKGLTFLGGWNHREKESCPCRPLFIGPIPKKLMQESDIIFVTVTDGALQQTIDGILNLLDEGHKPLLIHCSGILESKVFQEYTKFGILHPLKAVTKDCQEQDVFSGCSVGVEGDEHSEPLLHALAEALGADTTFSLQGVDRKLYHLSACVLANFSVVLGYMAENIAAKAGLVDPSVLYPLLRQSHDHILAEGTLKALTGPVTRGDHETLHKHMSALREHGFDSYESIYRNLAQVGVEMVSQSNDLSIEKTARLSDTLNTLNKQNHPTE